MKLTRHGTREILIATLLALACGGGIAFLALRVTAWLWLLLVIPVPIWLWVLWFFRDPERRTPQGEGLFVAPADGRVADITPIGPDSELGCEGVRIGIFMSVFNVHVNRMPCDARVEDITHHEGRFLDVRTREAIEHNEATTLRLSHKVAGQTWPIVVRQIAGLVARRIITEARPGDTYRRGQRFGMIKFGSRLELLVPASLAGEVRVKVGQPARAGETILYSIPLQEPPHAAD
jgi:phosphatidylserine decarboxylase